MKRPTLLALLDKLFVLDFISSIELFNRQVINKIQVSHHFFRMSSLFPILFPQSVSLLNLRQFQIRQVKVCNIVLLH